jgi:hypothetical protein
MMTAVLTALAKGRAGLGLGPQALGHLRSHHRAPAPTQAIDATTMVAKVRERHLPATVAPATTRSTGT